ncbi:Glycine cleavage system transcriptional activator GcvA [Alloalcanivorax xenomutans]|uniref:LysR substrate-binding domain-containing protein n=1 Tax=Alloalcanivorax xenomutans TaxID=1094342 RepID=UPI0006D5C361|nr:LysR substrate-binding domain-containing protein [Alloalcanivorax xenomutans]PHS69783.1 MAG: LysR family transcriptional regulator [Alcanivorax sp.]CUR46704.1 Glycine cleavage system transcriptional activator GcvA [Alloalcanivorax xenomutans]
MSARRLPPLSALRAFEATARLRSAKKAAEELSVTPTAISHQLRQLEEHLGVPLFIRRPRQLTLTAQGQALRAVCTDAFDAIDDVASRLRQTPQRQSVTLSTIPSVAARWLLPNVCYLREEQPDLNLSLQVTYDVLPLDGIAADMAIRYGHGPWPGLESEKLFDNVFVPACSPALGISQHSDLHHHTLLHYQPATASGAALGWPAWQKLARVAGLDIDAGLALSDDTHIVSAALDGQGIALMSRELIRDELRSGRLVQPFGPELLAQPFHLVYPKERLREQGIAAVRNWVMGLVR